MSSKAELLLRLHGFSALAVVFALPALEASAFIGFIFPGEIAVLLGGVLASQHRVPLAAVLAAAVLGAIIGDSIGYAIGRRYGRRMLDSTVGRFVRAEHLDRAEHHLRRRGGLAVFVGRFTAALRVLIPGLAGMSQMPYGTFAVYNVIGGLVWAVGFVLLGYAAGSSWQHAEHVARRAGLLVFAGVIAVGVILVAARWVARNQAAVRRRVGAVVNTSVVRGSANALRDNRLLPALAGTFAVLALLGWAAGFVVREVIGTGLVDRHVLELIDRHREPWLDSLNRGITTLGAQPSMWITVIGLGIAGRVRRGTWDALVALVISAAGGTLLVQFVKEFVHRPRPPLSLAVTHFGGNAFPSGHATNATLVWGMAAVVLGSTASTWARKVTAWTCSLVVILAVGATRIYLGAHWVTDVVAGWTLGSLWVASVAIALGPAARARRHAKSRCEPSEPVAS